MTVVTQAMVVTAETVAQLMAAIAASMRQEKITKLVVTVALEAPLMAALEAKAEMLVRQTEALAVTAA